MTNTDRLFNHEQGEELVRAVSEIAAAMGGDINVNAEISDIVNVYGAKNLLENTLSSGTSQSVTYTVNTNKSISFSGTAAATFTICIGVINVKQGKSYTLSGGYSSNVHLDLRVATSGSSAIWNNNTESKAVVSPQESGALLTFTANADETVYVHFRVGNGTNTSGAVLYPMIRLASIEDDTYVPYAKTNRELTADLMNEVATRAKLGAHNCVNFDTPLYGEANTSYTKTDTGVRITNTTSGTFKYYRFAIVLEKNTDYIISSDITVTSGEGGIVIRGDNTTSLLEKGPLNSGTVSFTFNSGEHSTWVFFLYSTFNTAAIGDVLYDNFMVRRASDLSTDFAPYAKTNKELTDDKAEKIDLTSINITSGTTNNTGSTIASGTFFYYKGSLVRAKTDIANGATLTLNTNYKVVTAGGLNALNSNLRQISAFKYTYPTTTVSTNAGVAVYPTNSLPSGAIVLGISYQYTDSNLVYMYYFDANNGTIALKNISSSPVTLDGICLEVRYIVLN